MEEEITLEESMLAQNEGGKFLAAGAIVIIMVGLFFLVKSLTSDDSIVTKENPPSQQLNMGEEN